VLKPRVAITVGDPAGIGPEIARKAADDPRVREVCEPVLYGPPPEHTFAVGQLSADAGRAAFDAICAAVKDAQAGSVHAVATAPVNKLAFSRAGLP
jgi:4-hydroxythreonine-4-phosphate dehydrogenase